MRIACLLVPDLPLRAELRAHPEWRGEPLAIASDRNARAEILAGTPEAWAAGILPGTPVSHARSLCADLHVRVASPALDQSTRECLLDIALSFSPRATPAPRPLDGFESEAAVLLDATGVSRLFDSEERFASALGARSEKLGLPGCVAVASTRGVARLVARQLALEHFATATASSPLEGSTSRVLAPGAEASFLSPLPIDLFAPSHTLAQALSRFGVSKVRDLLRLPSAQLTQRLGPEVAHLIACAQGREPDLPLPEHTETRVREGADLESSIHQLEPLLFVLRGILARLTDRLRTRHLLASALEVELILEGGGRDARRVELAAPTNDVLILLRLISLALEAHPPRTAIESTSISTVGAAPRTSQLDLFRPSGPDPSELDQALNELESVCGAGRVGTPSVADDHRPGAFTMAPFGHRGNGIGKTSSSPGGVEQPGSRNSAKRLAIRALRPPVTARIQLERGLPSHIQCAVANGTVLEAAGPWRTTGHWWSQGDRFATDTFDIQVSDGTVLRLCFDWLDRTWRVDAVYD